MFWRSSQVHQDAFRATEQAVAAAQAPIHRNLPLTRALPINKPGVGVEESRGKLVERDAGSIGSDARITFRTSKLIHLP